jgi:hypothetical protein
MMKRDYIYLIILAALWYILVWNNNVLGYYGGAPALIAISALLVIRLVKNNDYTASKPITCSRHNMIIFIVWIVLFGLLMWYASIIFAQRPIDINTSDIIPLLKEVYYQRFISGTYVYDTVYGYDYVQWTPNYLPMHWLPFVPAFAIQTDPRYVALLCFGMVQLYYVYTVLKQQITVAEKCLKSFVPIILLASIMHKQQTSFAHSVELLIVSYYSLLLLALINTHNWGTTLGLFLTSMSRYVSVFFIPIHFITLMLQKKKQALQTYGLLLVLVCCFYIVPFMWQQPSVFFDGAAAYDAAALGEWKGQNWQEEGSPPYQLFQGYGFAAHVYKVVGTQNLMDGIRVIKISMFVSLSLLMLAWGLYLCKHINIIQATYPIILYSVIVVLLSFVTVPYNYLFWNVLFAIPIITLNRRWL